jgi:DMSO/TMAO reductase YedYZ heme-binding membrane subunit
MTARSLPVGYLGFVGGICAAIVSVPELGPEEMRAVIRATAFTSAVPFLFAFTASTAHYFLRSATTRWLMAHRRYVGLCVAASHFWHLLAIVAFVRWYSAGGEPIPTVTLVFGGGGFVFLGLMAATSNDASQRVLGRWWSRLHTVGVYVLWIDFIVTYSGAATVSPFHAVMTLVFAAAWMARVVAFMGPRTR